MCSSFGFGGHLKVHLLFCLPTEQMFGRAGQIQNKIGRPLFGRPQLFAKNYFNEKLTHPYTISHRTYVHPPHIVVFIPSNYSRKTTSTHTSTFNPNIRSELVFPNIRSPEHMFDRPRNSGRLGPPTNVGAASVHGSCMGAASSSCIWPAGSCS